MTKTNGTMSVAIPEPPTVPLGDWTTIQVHDEGLRLALAYLARRGYEVLETGWRSDAGDVDIVARDGEAVVLIKTVIRRDETTSTYMPDVPVDRPLQRQFRKLALCYLLENVDVDLVRCDVVSVVITAARCARLRHLLGAYVQDER